MAPSRELPRGLGVLVGLSGATALVYESLWLRSFGLVFGNTTDAVAMVLVLFMAGLGLGSLLAAGRRAAAPLRAYARVELGVGLAALATLPLLAVLPRLYGALAGRAGLEGAADVFGRAVACAVVVLPATVLLGATVPLLVESLDRAGVDFTRSLSRLYLINTLGGAAGAYLATFVLVPTLGVRLSLVTAALVNLGIGAVAWRWSGERPQPAPSAAPVGSGEALPGRIAALAAISGAFTFGIEILWTRSFALVIGSSVYSFSLMLIAVLLGLVMGTALYARWRTRLLRTDVVLGALFVATGAAGALGAAFIGVLPRLSLALMRDLPATFAAHQVAAFLLCLVTMLPVTVALGFTFPLLAHGALPARGSAQEASGRLYLWNTVGAILGAALTDVVLVDRLGVQSSFAALAALPVAAGAWMLVPARSPRPVLRWIAAAAAAAAALVASRVWHPWNPLVMTSGVYRYGLEWSQRPGFRLDDLGRDRQLLFYREGREAVVAVAERPGTERRFLSVNGKTDAGNASEDVLTQKFLAHVPMLLHEAPRRALVIGWGSGATAASAALHPIETLECVEIEPATWQAAPFFDGLSGRVRTDPRFRIVFRDGRNHLLRSRATWDVIVSEPSNPWISGVANLFTREFYEIAAGRLAPRGVFGQWFHYYNMEPEDLKVELATFAAVFPHVSVWMVPPLPAEAGGTLTADLLLVGSREPHTLDWPRLERAFADPAIAADLRSTKVLGDELSLVASYAFDRAALLRFTDDRAVFPFGTPLNTDDRPWIEFRGPRRNVVPPDQVKTLAQQLYSVLSDASPDALPPLRDHPGLAAGGHDAAALHVAVAERWTERGQAGRAHRAVERALALEPTNEYALEMLAGMSIDAHEWPRAERLHRELLRVRPRDVDAQLRLAAVLARQSKWADARDALRQAAALDPQAAIDPALKRYVESQASR